MGISGLLPLLKSIQKPCNLRTLRGQTVGVDAYGWLHRGATACAIQLALGQPTTKYVEFAMNRVRLLQHCGVVPYLVFDGDYLPSKAGTETDRLARREEAKKLGQDLLRHGKTAQAQQEMQKAVDVTPEMAGLFIQELKRANIKYIVAPFEADSQLAYLEKHKLVDAVISEDSDLLVFGVRVLLTKLDQYGECVMIRQDDFQSCREISMANWDIRTFRQMAILSGCDYLDNIPNLGLKTAHRLLRKSKTVERTLQAIRLEGKLKVPSGYLENFTRAELTFLHQWVFCPMSKTMVNLNPVDQSQDLEKMMAFIGRFVDADVAAGVANGSLHPHTKKPLILPNIGQLQSRLTPLKKQQENMVSKKGTSITEFFRKRQPLAELDPNSFIMTPRQEELARNAASSSWTSPVASLTPSNARTEMRLIETPTQGRIKRQRLCHEADSILKEAAIDIKSAMTGESKFFASSIKKNKGKRLTRGFSIYSDDSLEEAMDSLPEPMSQSKTQPQQEPEVPSFHDSVPKDRMPTFEECQSADNEDSQITLVAASSPLVSAEADLEDAEATFVEESDEVIQSHSAGLFDGFMLDKPSKMPASLQRRTPSITKAYSTPFPEPKQTLASETNGQSTLVVDKSGCSVVSAKAGDVRGTNRMFGPVLVPTSSPLNPVDSLAQLSKGQGSEDQIISDSEYEDDKPSKSSKVLDLTRFQFIASA